MCTVGAGPPIYSSYHHTWMGGEAACAVDGFIHYAAGMVKLCYRKQNPSDNVPVMKMLPVEGKSVNP